MILHRYSLRFAEEVLNSKLSLKKEIEEVLLSPTIDLARQAGIQQCTLRTICFEGLDKSTGSISGTR